MKVLILITLSLVSTISLANTPCKPVDTYFTNAEYIKMCARPLFNSKDKKKVMSTNKVCIDAAKRIDKNQLEITKMDQNIARSCFMQRSFELSQAKQLYTFFNQYR